MDELAERLGFFPLDQSESLFVPDFVDNMFHFCGCPDADKCERNCAAKFDASAGRCSGVFHTICECQIDGEWVSKGQKC